MGSRIQVTIDGVPELRALFDSMPRKVQNNLARKAFRKAAKRIKQDAQQRVPVDSGALQRTIKIVPMKRKKNRIGIMVMLPTREELAREQPTAERAAAVFLKEGYYPGVVEYGDSKHEPRPYLRPALLNNVQVTLDLIADSIRDAVEKDKEES